MCGRTSSSRSAVALRRVVGAVRMIAADAYRVCAPLRTGAAAAPQRSRRPQPSHNVAPTFSTPVVRAAMEEEEARADGEDAGAEQGDAEPCLLQARSAPPGALLWARRQRAVAGQALCAARDEVGTGAVLQQGRGYAARRARLPARSQSAWSDVSQRGAHKLNLINARSETVATSSMFR